MTSVQQQNHHIQYTNSAQRVQLFQQAEFHQSCSGSETDVSASTSTENLTHEEKYVLRTSIRQEPQGEENVDSNRSMDQSSCNTLIIHKVGNSKELYDTGSPTPRQPSLPDYYRTLDQMNTDESGGGNLFSYGHDDASSLSYHYLQYISGGKTGGSPQYSNDVPLKSPSPKFGRHHHLPPSSATAAFNQRTAGTPPRTHKAQNGGGRRFSHDGSRTGSSQDLTGIPKYQLDQSEILKHFVQDIQNLGNRDGGGDDDHDLESCSTSDDVKLSYDMSKLPPPPEYPKWRRPEFKPSAGKRTGRTDRAFNFGANRSRSQPDLSQVGDPHWDGKFSANSISYLNQIRPKTRGRAASDAGVDHEGIALRTAEIIELLGEENANLKAELDIYYSKVSKLQKFDMEIQKVHQSYEELVKSSEKRDRLGRAVCLKLEMEIRRLHEVIKDQKDQVELATAQLGKRQPHEMGDSELRKELSRRDLLIAQLITQNKELAAGKERQEIELAAQRATLQEQRTHIDILDTALTNAQVNVVNLEEECRKKQAYVDRVEQLQKALSSLQQASDKREQMEKRLRNQLEKEIQELRAQKDGQMPFAMGASSGELSELKRHAREMEERWMASQAEVSKLEQRCFEESAMRQIAIDSASMPKDARIAALERTSQESERIITQARSDKMRHMDEVHATNKKCADLESRIKDLESKLAEKDAMIRVLQKHSMEKDVVYQNAMMRSPLHTPHTSIHASLPSSTKASSTACLGDGSSSSGPAMNNSNGRGGGGGAAYINPIITASTITSCLSITSTSMSKTAADVTTKTTLDKQLKELDSQLLSKDSIINALRTEKEKFPSHFWRV